LNIVEVFRTVCCSACAKELVAGLLRPRLFPFGKLSKLKSAAQVCKGGLRQINTCRKVPLQVNFLDDDILLWCLYS
jgi:hypothetical protein